MDDVITKIEATLDLPKSRCAKHPDILRFSVCDLGNQRQGYRWGSVLTHSIEIVECLNAMWNNRRAIAAALRGMTDGN